MSAPTIAALFASAVRAHHEREALVTRRRRWTYGELGAVVAAGAKVLRDRGCEPGGRVAIIAANTDAYVAAYFSILLTGASTVEAGRDESPATLARIFELSRPCVVLTDRDDLGSCSAGLTVLTLAEFLEACQRESGTLGETATCADAEASVVFTSGTTGPAKGVVLSHRSILFVVEAVRQYLGLKPEDRYALVLPLCHTYGKSNLLSAIAAGAATVLIDDFQNLVQFFDLMARERCSVLSVVPFHLNVIARRGLPAGCDLPSLRAVTTSGGPLPAETASRLARLLPHALLYSMYGLTESSTRATYLEPKELPIKIGSVGRPLPGMGLQIRSADGATVASGTAGHVWLRGPNIMSGYLNEPGATAAVLVDGWLDTGDVGYLDEAGCLFITGREKEIIKVAGERISPSEIEAVVVSHPSIADAAVVGRTDALLGEVPWAYVVANGQVDLTELGAFCTARLSHHKVPRRFVECPAIPRTPTGKIRRHLLKEGHNP